MPPSSASAISTSFGCQHGLGAGAQTEGRRFRRDHVPNPRCGRGTVEGGDQEMLRLDVVDPSGRGFALRPSEEGKRRRREPVKHP